MDKQTIKRNEAVNILKEAIPHLLKGVELQHKLSRSKVLNELLLNLGISYVIDPETKEVIWVNDNLSEALKMDKESIIGKNCFTALQGELSVCNFCKFDEAKAKPGVPYKWLHQNKINKKIYLVYDIYLPTGFNGYERPLHLEKAFEIEKEYFEKFVESYKDGKNQY